MVFIVVQPLTAISVVYHGKKLSRHLNSINVNATLVLSPIFDPILCNICLISVLSIMSQNQLWGNNGTTVLKSDFSLLLTTGSAFSWV